MRNSPRTDRVLAVALVMLAHCDLALRRRDTGANTPPPEPRFVPVPNQGMPATLVAGFPPEGSREPACLVGAVHEQLFILVMEEAVHARDGP